MIPPTQLTAFLISSPLTKDLKTFKQEKLDLRKAHFLELHISFRLLRHPCRIFSRFDYWAGGKFFCFALHSILVYFIK